MTPAERLLLARESINEAKLLQGERIGNKVVFTKLYHALMYCLFALFDVRIIGNLTHEDIIDRFEREYVRSGDFGAFGEGLLGIIRHAYALTHECDCDHMPVPADKDVKAAMQAADGFVRTVENCLHARQSVG